MIYAIRAVGTEYVKIGISNTSSGADRITALQISCPFELSFVAQAEWPDGQERCIHVHLKRTGCHVRGEWFRETGETLLVLEYMRNGKRGLAQWTEHRAKCAGRLGNIIRSIATR